ncbi:putative hydro-lyase [Micrococcus endophyticus]
MPEMTTTLPPLDGATTPAQARERFRAGLVRPTSGIADGYAQANLVSIPQDHAYDVLLFAQRNPKALPLLGVFEAGEVNGPALDGDVRTDVPQYVVYRDGVETDRPTDLLDVWRDDLVTFVIGCSFTFESALVAEGIRMAHQDAGVNVPMYRTTRRCASAGRLSGPLVVSMRPIPADRVADAVRITSRYPAVHGAPVHVGDPAGLGITDLSAPDFGDAVEVPQGHLPVFWACGVTPQAAIMESRPPLAITHAPGHMLITDLPDRMFQVP